MKKLKSYLKFIVLVLTLSSCSKYNYLIKHQSNSVTIKRGEGHITAHLEIEKKHHRFHKNRMYYSFKKVELFQTQGTLNGTALHGKYSEFYPSGGLMESGKFSHGLKVGTWYTWHSNGYISSKSHFHRGKKTRFFKTYDETHEITMRQFYFCNKKLFQARYFVNGKRIKRNNADKK